VSSNAGNPQVPAVVPPIVIRVRPELPSFVPAAGRSGFVRPPSRSQAGSVVPPAAGRSGPVLPPSRNQSGVEMPLRVPAAGRSGPFGVESFVRPSSPVPSAFRPYVPTVVPQPPPASPSERGQSVGSMPALVPIMPPTFVAGHSSDDGFPPPIRSPHTRPIPMFWTGDHLRNAKILRGSLAYWTLPQWRLLCLGICNDGKCLLRLYKTPRGSR
jgi:hypothetical protein